MSDANNEVGSWKQVLASSAFGAFGKLMPELGDYAGKFISAANTRPADLARSIRSCLQDHETQNQTLPTEDEVATRFSTNLITARDLSLYFDARVSARAATEFTATYRLPFSLAKLRECQHTHILVPVMPQLALTPEEFGRSYRSFFHCQVQSAKDDLEYQTAPKVGWHLVRKTLVAKGADLRTISSRVPEGEKSLELPMIVYTMLQWKRIRGEQLCQVPSTILWSKVMPYRDADYPREGISVGCVTFNIEQQIDIAKIWSVTTHIAGMGIMTECKPDFEV